MCKISKVKGELEMAGNSGGIWKGKGTHLDRMVHTEQICWASGRLCVQMLKYSKEEETLRTQKREEGCGKLTIQQEKSVCHGNRNTGPTGEREAKFSEEPLRGLTTCIA